MKNGIVKWTMLFLLVGILGWDLYLWLDGVSGNTISHNITAWSIAHPWSMYLITFCVVGLLWHWYRGRPIPVGDQTPKNPRRRKLILGALALLAVGALGMAFVELIGFY